MPRYPGESTRLLETVLEWQHWGAASGLAAVAALVFMVYTHIVSRTDALKAELRKHGRRQSYAAYLAPGAGRRDRYRAALAARAAGWDRFFGPRLLGWRAFVRCLLFDCWPLAQQYDHRRCAGSTQTAHSTQP